MKSYEEVAKSVFEKSEKYFEEKAVRAKRIKTAVTAMSCFCLAAVITVGAVAALNSNLTEYPVGGKTEGQFTSEPESDENIPAADETTTAAEPTSTETEIPTDAPETEADDTDVVCQLPVADPQIDYKWQTVDEILGADYGIASAEEATNYYLVYDGAFYAGYSPEDEKTGRYYAATGEYAYFHNSKSPCEVYAIKGEPDLIAIITDSYMCEYRRLCCIDFKIDGEKYEIAYPAYMQVDYDCGDTVLKTEDYTVYKAITMQGEPTDVYLINLLPVLKKEIPGWYDLIGDNDYPVAYFVDAWWVATLCVPVDNPSNYDYAVPEYDFSDDKSLPLKTLTDLTPKDTDQILSAAQAVSSEKYGSVFVLAETGNEIYSLADGVVVMADWGYGTGWTVEVETADGQHIRHFHLSEMLAEAGDAVTKGQVIGLAGTTGATTHSGAGYHIITDHTESHASETHEPESHASETHEPESHTPETHAPETHAPETHEYDAHHTDAHH